MALDKKPCNRGKGASSLIWTFVQRPRMNWKATSPCGGWWLLLLQNQWSIQGVKTLSRSLSCCLLLIRSKSSELRVRNVQSSFTVLSMKHWFPHTTAYIQPKMCLETWFGSHKICFYREIIYVNWTKKISCLVWILGIHSTTTAALAGEAQYSTVGFVLIT